MSESSQPLSAPDSNSTVQVTLSISLQSELSYLPTKFNNQLDIFILNDPEKLSLDHAKPFKKVANQENHFEYKTEFPENKTFEFRLFAGVRRGNTEEISLLSVENKTRKIQLNRQTEQTFNLGYYGYPNPELETSESEAPDILKNPCLLKDHAYTLTFDNTQCPLIALDFNDAKEVSIDCVSAENVNFMHCFASTENRPMIQDKDSVVTYQFRSFAEKSDKFLLEFEIVTADNEVVGTFEFNPSHINKKSQGNVWLDVKNGNVIGKIHCSYLHVQPMKGNENKLPHGNGYKYWKSNSKKQLRGGHRGSGNSFTGDKLSDIRENTIASFEAAFEQGKADFVEFDVTNTRDEHSVVYHDLGLAIDGDDTTINEQTLTALQEACGNDPITRVQHLSEVDERKEQYKGKLQFDVSQPWEIPLLSDMFKKLPSELGFNLEVKWPCINVLNQSENMLHTRRHWFDINKYIDQILDVVLENCKERNLIFSCFDPNVCYCLQLKQSDYPVMQLTTGDSGHYTDQRDLRIRRNSTAIQWSKHVGYLAINTLVKDVLDNYDLVEKAHDAGLKLFVYGDDMQDLTVLNRLKESSLDALVYDVIHQVQ